MLFPPGVNFTAAVRVWCRETLSNQRGNDRRVAQHMVRPISQLLFLPKKDTCRHFWLTVVVSVA